MMKIEHLVDYALSFVGTPYRWGGDDPMSGFDCSGLTQEILAAAGEDPVGDQTAHTLYLHFKRYGIIRAIDADPEAGDLAFYGTNFRITHVGFCIDSYCMVEAGGGGRRTRTEKDAETQNAYVRLRPIRRRSDLVAILSPHYLNVW